MRISDWSSDVCSSDLLGARHVGGHVADDVETADLRQPRARLGLEAIDARVALKILEDGQLILFGAGGGRIDGIVEPVRIAGEAEVEAVGLELERGFGAPDGLALKFRVAGLNRKHD